MIKVPVIVLGHCTNLGIYVGVVWVYFYAIRC